MFYAHSIQGRDKGLWQPLRAHSIAVSRLAGSRGQKFGASQAASVAGLLHDLGKYTEAFQRRLEGSDKVDHATAGAQEILTLASNADDALMAHVIAHAIAGHHAGLPDTLGDAGCLSERLKKNVGPLDAIWRQEISPAAIGLRPSNFDWGDRKSLGYRLAFFGRMLFSCLVDADFRDTEGFYSASEGRTVDREWPKLPAIVDDLISRFNCHMAAKVACAKDTPVNRLRAEILEHARACAGQKRGSFTLTVPTGGGKTPGQRVRVNKGAPVGVE